MLDPFDRKILGVLATDATVSYAALGEKVGLSAPAVHERVKRLRKTGVIKATTAWLDGEAVGKPLLAFVHVDTTGWSKGPQMMKLQAFPEIEEMHSVAGDACLILKVRARNARDLEAVLSQIYAVPGVTATRSYVVLSSYFERPVQAEITETWPGLPTIRE